MTEAEALEKMIAPGTPRRGKYREGVVQIHVTRACDKACFNCTQGSNLAGKPTFMTPDQFEEAVRSLSGYFGVIGVFGGNPALSPHFEAYCAILKKHVPFDQRGLWCNNARGKGRIMAETFAPHHSNINVHLDRDAYEEFRRDWPECHPVGLETDSRHSPPFVAIKDVVRKTCDGCDGEGSLMYQMAKKRCVETGGMSVALPDGSWYYQTGDRHEIEFKTIGGYCADCEGKGTIPDESAAWELIAGCDINRNWSSILGVFRGSLRAWFCEIAGAQAMLHQDEPDYPDTGMIPVAGWWRLPMSAFAAQVRKHCHECGVPLRGHGELSQAIDGKEQVSETHAAVYRPKRVGRRVELVTVQAQLGAPLKLMTDYLGNASK